jgi:large repetitive protein
MRARTGLFGAILTVLIMLVALGAGPVASAVAAPTLTMDTSPGGTTTNITTPSFGGSTNDFVDAVVVKIYAGNTASGSPVQTPTSETPATGTWGATASPLAEGTYTAVAEQAELGGLLESTTTSPVTFTVITASPAVTLNSISSPSSNTTPSFSGEASDTTPVVVHIYNSSSEQVASAEATNAPGTWNSGSASPALSSGQYTAVATQSSSLGNPAGTSNGVKFTISTASPSVTLKSITSPSNKTKPSFSGEATDTTPVVVHIYNVFSVEVSSAEATNAPGEWNSGQATSPLSSGQYTAVATQASSLGNPQGASNTINFTVETASPTVTLNQPPSPSKDSTPSFTGTASDTEAVTVRIYKGGKAEGSPISAATASGTGGSWSSGEASPSLSAGEYTAQASQPSSLGNPAGKSNAVTFTINTSPPTVTLNSIKTPSNNTTPSFTGFASDTETVTIHIYSGSTEVSSATAGGTGGDWSSGGASPALSSGQYSAIATQASSLGNPTGKSNTVTFTVSTAAPTVALSSVKSPSNNTTPSFTGFASDTEQVTIHIYPGSTPTGTEVASAAATGTGGNWSSGQASPALSSGQYTAIATQPSSLGNPSGTSNAVTFTVDTSSPTVTLNSPPALSKDTTPLFTGTATDSTKVVVHIFDSTNTEVASAATTPGGGTFSTENESSLASGSYTAIATQASLLGNPQGVSNLVSFTVNTAPPTVTLNSPAVRSNNTTPAFTGTGTDNTAVTVEIFKGSKAEGTAVSTASASGTGGGWTSGNAAPALANGQYTAVAIQSSSLGNPAGRSPSVTFEVDTSAPTVILNQLASPNNVTVPAFSGTGSDTETVTIQVFKGKKAEGTVVASATAPGTGGVWSSGNASPALVSGEYTAIATQPSSLKNKAGVSTPMTFTVETASPKVTLNQLAKPLSNNATPAFTGTATDITPVTVEIFKATAGKPEGAFVATATAGGTGAAWTSAATTPALASGEYSAIARQPSSAHNPDGLSKAIVFTVNTAPPTVTLVQPKSPNNNLTPTFTGTATDTTKVVIRILDAANLEVAKATATPSGSGTPLTFTTSNEASLSNGTYTATATQESSLGNKEGVSNVVTFTVNTLPPTVTLIAPPSPSNTRAPIFTGTASDTMPVTVEIYLGTTVTGTPIATATSTVPETCTAPLPCWTSGPTTPELPKSKRIYTAVAREKSSILGNPTGVSSVVHFIVDPEAPTVALNSPPARTNNTTPSFTGSAEDNTPVTVEIYAGAGVEGKPKPFSTATATGTGGGWASGPASPALPDGPYTVVSSQYNQTNKEAVGSSQRFTFTVDTVPPHVVLSAPASGSSTSGGSEAVSGTAGTEEGDLPHVTVRLYPGPTIGGQAPLQSITVNTIGKNWSATVGGLTPGTYTLRAEQPDTAGNTGVSAPSTFVVNGSLAPAPPPPSASFSWFPSSPRAGESVSLASSSTDPTSAITAFAWDVAGTGLFATGGPGTTTTFSTPGNHLVQLRVTDANGLSSVASATIPVGAPLFTLMQPFPIVRITSTRTRSGVRLRQLGVLAAPGAKITVICKGRACPAKSQSHMASVSRARSGFIEFRRFERNLPAGVVLEIRVTRAGRVGKYTRFVVRRGKVPVRFDACLDGLLVKPVGCPAL